MKYDLLPCPFCASDDVEIDKQPAGYDSAVQCNQCGAFGPTPQTTGDEHEAVALWNQRLDSEREPEE